MAAGGLGQTQRALQGVDAYVLDNDIDARVWQQDRPADKMTEAQATSTLDTCRRLIHATVRQVVHGFQFSSSVPLPCNHGIPVHYFCLLGRLRRLAQHGAGTTAVNVYELDDGTDTVMVKLPESFAQASGDHPHELVGTLMYTPRLHVACLHVQPLVPGRFDTHRLRYHELRCIADDHRDRVHAKRQAATVFLVKKPKEQADDNNKQGPTATPAKPKGRRRKATDDQAHVAVRPTKKHKYSVWDGVGRHVGATSKKAA